MASVSVELVRAARRINAARFWTPSMERRLRTNAVCAVGEKAALARNWFASFSDAPIALRDLRLITLRSVGELSRTRSSSELERAVGVRATPITRPPGGVTRDNVAPPANVAHEIP